MGHTHENAIHRNKRTIVFDNCDNSLEANTCTSSLERDLTFQPLQLRPLSSVDSSFGILSGPFSSFNPQIMADFVRDFMAGVHGNELDSSRYRCTDRITDVGQKILAIAMSPDGRMYVYGGACSDTLNQCWK